ncbi:MAG: TrkA family potassium uptake protein [Chloroflexi bacterium]|nr:TrkA family potassium uptake protein [Chloroflexota bacterium]
MTHEEQKTASAPHIIVVGCGRLGAELAMSLSQQKYSVAIIDSDHQAFQRLDPNFRGQAVEGEGLDQDSLERAGIRNAYGFAAVTTLDSINIITCRIARDIYHVSRVVARLYNPTRASIYQKLNLQTVASSSWAAQRVEQTILNPGLQSVHSAGNGEVHLYEMIIPETLAGKKINDLLPSGEAVISGLTRAGRAQLPTNNQALETRDILLVTATTQGAAVLQKLLDQVVKE